MVTVLESCRVSPPREIIAEKSLPLAFFDILWIPFHPLGRVIFFDIPCSTNHFSQNILPNLKTSLSLALKHFFPLAGNLIKPSTPDFQIRYVEGDSLTIIFAECTGDFNHFSGNHARDADILKQLVPELPSAGTCVQVSGEDCYATPVLAIQVTVFPNQGISFGFTNSHVVADGRSMFNFIQAWASIAKQVMVKSDDDVVVNFQIPYYDRSLVKKSLGLAKIFTSKVGGVTAEQNIPDQSAGDTKARLTFILKQADIEALKNQVIKNCPKSPHISSFVVVCAYIWTCMAKLRAAVVKDLEEEPLNFGIAYDCRARLDPPLPASYFGNCILACVPVEKRKVLVGQEGLFIAAELIGKSLHAKLNNQEGVLKNADKLFETELAGLLKGEWYLGVAGSPKLDYYNTVDFGWGKPKKFEFVSEPFSISRSKDSKADLELGFIMAKNEVDVFSSIFAQGLVV